VGSQVLSRGERRFGAMDSTVRVPVDDVRTRGHSRSLERFLTASDWREVLVALEADGNLLDSSDSGEELTAETLETEDLSQTLTEFLDAADEPLSDSDLANLSGAGAFIASPFPRPGSCSPDADADASVSDADRLPLVTQTPETPAEVSESWSATERALYERGFRRDERITTSLSATVEQTPISIVQIAKQVLRNLKAGELLPSISLPAWLLEPLSATEKVALAMRYGELLAAWATEPDPFERFLKGMQYFLSGLPNQCSLRKPFNPVLGETFMCAFPHREASHGITSLFCEQVSHHPPRTAMHMRNSRLGVRIHTVMEPRPSFGGNSLKIEMAGHALMELTHAQDVEQYILTRPAMVFSGILGVGKQQLECIGKCIFHCPKLGFLAKFDFSGVSLAGLRGSEHAVEGKLYVHEQKRYRFYGRWDDCIYLKDLTNGETRLLYNAGDVYERCRVQIWIPPEPQQSPKFARTVWRATADALLRNDFERATVEKRRVEACERELRSLREQTGETWQPQFFELDPLTGIYIFNDKHRHFVEMDPEDLDAI